MKAIKIYAHITFWILFFSLMIGNIYVFAKGVQLSNEIHQFETGLGTLAQENRELETKIYKRTSFQYAASISAELDFMKRAEPLYVGEPGYAQN